MEKIVIIFVLFFLVAIYFVTAVDITPTTLSVELKNNTIYDIVIDNVNPGADSNITIVKITIPSSFTFIPGSNSTDAPYETFSSSATTVTWTNSTGYLINGTETKTFSFRATASTINSYNLTVDITNGTGIYSYKIPTNVSDTTPPTISFIDPTPEDQATLYINYLPVKINASDLGTLDTISLKLYNSTGLIQTKTSTTSPFSYNFTNLPYETYRIDADANDSFGQASSTPRRTIMLDALPNNTLPDCTPNWNCTAWSNDCLLDEVEKERTCTDENSCNNNTNKPYEIYMCGDASACTSSWSCTAWLPEKCPKNQTKARTCTDENSCVNATGKPLEEQTCEYQSGSNFLFIGIIAGVIVLIVAGAIVTIILMKKKKSGQTTTQTPTIQPTTTSAPPAPATTAPPPSKPL